MATGNGWTKWLVGTLWSLLIGIIIFIGNVVRANDVTNWKEHIAIKEEIVYRDEKILEKIERKMENLSKDQILLQIQNAQILEILKQLKEKLP